MTIPTLVLAILIASLYASLYHLIRGGGIGRLTIFLLLSWMGFASGHYVGIRVDWLLFPLGQLNLGMSTIGSLILLILGDWVTRIKKDTSHPLSNKENEV